MKANRVLIPLDDSTFSLNVLPHVTRLLEPENTDLYLLHVEPNPESVVVDERVVVYADQAAASIQSNSLDTLRPFVHSLEELGYHVTPLVTFGDPASEIERYTADRDIDLIAMATHGRTGLSRFWRGSVAQDVIGRVEVPVLLYRAVPEEDESALGE